MKSSTQTSLFIFSLCIIFYAPLPAISISLYESLCNENNPPSRNIQLCLNLLKTDPKITSATNYHDLSQHILEKAAQDAQVVNQDLIEARKRFPNDPAVKTCINLYYDTVIRGFVDAMSILPIEPKTAKDKAISAGFGANNCQKAFEKPEEKNVLATIHLRNNEIFFLGVIASLSIIHLL